MATMVGRQYLTLDTAKTASPLLLLDFDAAHHSSLTLSRSLSLADTDRILVRGAAPASYRRANQTS